MNITDPIRRHAELRPHEPAVVRPTGETVTYYDLDRSIDALAKRLTDLRLVAGNTVALLIPNEYPVLLVSLALARLGIASGPPGLPDDIADVRIAFDDAEASDRRILVIDPLWLEKPPASMLVAPIPSHPDGSAICTIVGSSGTTGVPKYAALSHDMLHRRVLVKQLLMPLPDAPRHISAFGPGGSYGFREVLGVLWAGGLVVLTTSPDSVVQSVARYAVNHLVASPGALKFIVDALPPRSLPFPSLERVEVGGSLLPKRLFRAAARHLCPNVLSLYGAMEAGSLAAAPMAALPGAHGAVGYVVTEAEIEAVDDNDVPLPAGSEGILRVRGATCVDSYIGDRAGSAKVFRDGWFYPGDVGSVAADRLLTITGRTSEFINSGGTKVSPQVIEEVLLAMPRVVDAAAFGVPDDSGLTRIWAAIVTDGPVEASALSARCREILRERAPEFILRVPELPRNEGGKIARRRLAEMAVVARSRLAARA